MLLCAVLCVFMCGVLVFGWFECLDSFVVCLFCSFVFNVCSVLYWELLCCVMSCFLVFVCVVCCFGLF